jgi:hypothetical protein
MFECKINKKNEDEMIKKEKLTTYQRINPRTNQPKISTFSTELSKGYK